MFRTLLFPSILDSTALARAYGRTGTGTLRRDGDSQMNDDLKGKRCKLLIPQWCRREDLNLHPLSWTRS
jgi:hypothetical protein